MTSEILSRLPTGFEMWPPMWQAAAIFFSTFVLEDAAAIGAGVLLAAGALAWPLAFASCFLGIWVGDAGLYALARLVGRNWFERSPLRRLSNRVEQSERWFADRGNSILVFSRLVPGARLPTYLAAGFLRLPLGRFLLVTGLASLVWTSALLLATQVVGGQLSSWLAPFRNSLWIALAGCVILLFAVKMIKRLTLVTSMRKKLAVTFLSRKGSGAGSRTANANPEKLETDSPNIAGRLFIRLLRWKYWEFWPAWMFYTPVAVYYLWLAIKCRGVALPTVANPGIFTGGVIGESKMATLQTLMDTSPDFTADAELLAGTTPEQRLSSLRCICQSRCINYPFILKPDIGQRGAGVKVIHGEQAAIDYLAQVNARLLVQRYAQGPREVGVFYYRFPDQPRGQIFAVTEKTFPVLIGDGRSTVSDLIWADPRARYMAIVYLQRLKGREADVLAEGQSLRLVQAGNHAQGTIFTDGMHLRTSALTERIDAISRKVPGFYIGRYDIRYSSEAELREGKNFKIIELNGAASEATSIYDRRNSVLAAYRTLFRQWDLVFAIGAANHQRGHQPTRLAVLWQSWREYCRCAATYPVAD